MSPMGKTADDAEGEQSWPRGGAAPGAGARGGRAPGSGAAGQHSFVVVASRLPVDRIESPEGETHWRPSPGGLVTALEPVSWFRGWCARSSGPAAAPLSGSRKATACFL